MVNYRFDGFEELGQPPMGTKDPEGRLYNPYFPGQGLVKAVQLAIDLERPLLLEGDPGCGKTELAKALVYWLSRKNLSNDDWWPFFIWNVKSYSQAREGLYTFDAVTRLRDAQLLAINKSDSSPPDASTYVRYGSLGNALQVTDRRAVLLIDEIDKADGEFGNDLLLELDQFYFEVPEINKRIPEISPASDSTPLRPIVIITSNCEKSLPNAFLRRCLYFKIPFPDSKEQLRKIAESRHQVALELRQGELFDRAVVFFQNVRSIMAKSPLGRQPSTSEFLDFLRALDAQNYVKVLDELQNPNLAECEESSYGHILGTLLKREEDRNFYMKILKQEGKANGR